jgi:hypothetical protein
VFTYCTDDFTNTWFSSILFQDGKIEIELALGLSPGTVQRIKKYFVEDRVICDTFRRYMVRNIGEYEWVPKFIIICE